MKIAEIDWQLFWHALGQQRFTDRDRWLGRWVFAAAGVRLSMRSVPPRIGDAAHKDRRETLADHFPPREAAGLGGRTEQTGYDNGILVELLAVRRRRDPAPAASASTRSAR
jgi:hypothetical protein